ncbi:MAG: flagellar hook-associated protein FlgL [Pseudobdellovibrionaceae bacterium]
MRIADKMKFSQVEQNISRNRTEMADLQNQAATQKRINKPSDDPLTSTRVLHSRTEERGNNQFVKNINNAKAFLEFSDQALGELSESLIRAKELAISQANDASGNEDSRLVTASEVGQIFNQAVQIGNRKFGDRFIFAGHKTQAAPFNRAGEYFGDDGDIKIQIHKNSFIPMNISGDKVFFGKGTGRDNTLRVRYETPTTVPELKDFQQEEISRKEKNMEQEQNLLQTRGPASMGQLHRIADPVNNSAAVNVFSALKSLEISMKANDKMGIQECLDSLDQAISQVVLARSEVGSRVTSINSTMDSLQKATMDNKILASQLEDADAFQVVSDINKKDTALKATLETSGKLIQTSLLDFLR